MSKGISFKQLNGSKLKIGIVVSRWNREVTVPLLEACQTALKDARVKSKNIFVVEVPGAYELVYAAHHLIKTKKLDAVICLGCLIKGETLHFEYIAEAVAQGIMNLNLETGVPVVFGVLACLNEAQALARATGDNNHGYGWGMTAIEMGLIKRV